MDDDSKKEAPAPAPGALLVYDNPDKKATRPSGTGPWMPTWPFRLLLSGPPGSGKRNMLMNVVFRMYPPPSAIHCVHYDPDTTEYAELEQLGSPIYYYTADDFPTADNLSAPDPPQGWDYEAEARGKHGEEWEEKTDEEREALMAEARRKCSERLGTEPLVIIDELTKDILPPESTSRFERLMNFGSTHRNATVICSIQDVIGIPPKVRRAFNEFCLWRSPDSTATTVAATKVGVPPKMLQELFELCTDRHDCIWIDSTQPPDSEWRFRLNFLTPIRAVETVCYDDYR